MKKLVSLLLCAVLGIGILPMIAHAEETAAQPAVKYLDTYGREQTEEDYTELTDKAGKLVVNRTGKDGIYINSGDLTINGGTLTVTGEVSDIITHGTEIYFSNTLTLSGGTIVLSTRYDFDSLTISGDVTLKSFLPSGKGNGILAPTAPPPDPK